MTSSTALVTTNQNEVEDDIFSDLEPIDPFNLKKDYLSAQLAALMSFSGKSRSALADELGWKKSRITNVLSGRSNLTIKTIWEFVSHCGFDFDVVFRAPDAERPRQPWQLSKPIINTSVLVRNVSVSDRATHAFGHVVIQIQTAAEVAQDLHDGNHKSHYFYLNIPKAVETTQPAIEAPILAGTFFFQKGISRMALVNKESE